jgi:hypothetical protein
LLELGRQAGVQMRVVEREHAFDQRPRPIGRRRREPGREQRQVGIGHALQVVDEVAHRRQAVAGVRGIDVGHRHRIDGASIHPSPQRLAPRQGHPARDAQRADQQRVMHAAQIGRREPGGHDAQARALRARQRGARERERVREHHDAVVGGQRGEVLR